MISKQEVMNIINVQLKNDGFNERVEAENFKHENNAEKCLDDVLVIKHPNNQYAIVISCDEERLEWTIEYFGTHEHLYCQTPESVLQEMYHEILAPILRSEWAVASGYKKDSPCYGMQITCCYIPKEIENKFTDVQRKLAKNFKVMRWSGEITEEKTKCYVTADAEKYLKLRQGEKHV